MSMLQFISPGKHDYGDENMIYITYEFNTNKYLTLLFMENF